ncbi:hypothetical protein [Deinococcus sedimenti]|uniref:hypothetical protein n=1 Tax=Deinococcus sedimenti TaxID=1867090 RepID=UPI001E6263E1|nr:hypothetical protein [Deinococcus sedimenti]
MFNLTVSEAHTYYVGNDGWLVHNQGYAGSTGPVPYGTGASQWAIMERNRLGIGANPNRNLAVFFTEGQQKPLIYVSKPGVPLGINHAEQIGLRDLQ